MWYRTFFSINGQTKVDTYQSFSPLPIISLSVTLIFAIGLIASLAYYRTVLKNNTLAIYFMLISLIYLLALFLTDYQGYLYTGQTTAINGRYLVALMLPLGYISCLGLRKLVLALKNHQRIKLMIVSAEAVLIICLIEGGGVLAFMVNSNQNWYWPNSIVRTINLDAQHVTQAFIVGRNSLHMSV
jgi:hypothetical protein